MINGGLGIKASAGYLANQIGVPVRVGRDPAADGRGRAGDPILRVEIISPTDNP